MYLRFLRQASAITRQPCYGEYCRYGVEKKHLFKPGNIVLRNLLLEKAWCCLKLLMAGTLVI